MTKTTNLDKLTIQHTLLSLIELRETWENGAYKQANAELYAILEQCGAMYAQLREDKKQARAFNAAADEMGIAFNKRTSMALKIVRAVFGQQRSREAAYARVIKTWYEERADMQTLANFVIERGGIENVRREARKADAVKLTADDYRDIAANTLTGEYALASFGVQDYMLSDSENDTDYIVALVHCDGSGNGKIVYGSNKRTLVNNALAVMGKEIDELQQNVQSKDTLDDIKRQKTADMKRFVAQALTLNAAA